MKDEFLGLAQQLLKRLERELPSATLKDDYVYNKIPQLINDVKTWKFSAPKTDIGSAAIRLLDMGVYKEKRMVDDIVRLGELYRLMQKPAARIK